MRFECIDKVTRISVADKIAYLNYGRIAVTKKCPSFFEASIS